MVEKNKMDFFRGSEQMNNRLDIKTSGTLNKGFVKEKYGKSKQLRLPDE